MGFIYWVARIIVEPFYRLFFPTKRYGYKEEKYDGSTVIICNHLSNFDSVTTAITFKNKSYYLCKKELFSNKFFGFFVKAFGGIGINRDKPEFNELKTALKLLKDRKRLIIFPEGTRNKSGEELLEIKGGAGMFAFKAKARIIPMYIDRPNRFLRMNHLYIGKPFTLEEFYGEKFNAEVSDKINEKMKEQILECKKLLEERLNNRKKNK